MFLLCAVALCGVVNAQMSKGNWVVSGSTTVSFSNASSKFKYDGNSTDGPKISTFMVAPSVGYFVTDNIAVGMDLTFISVSDKDVDGDKTTSNTTSIMPMGTYYFKGDTNLVPYAGVGVGYASFSNKFTSSNFDYKTTSDGLSWKAKGGIVYLLTPSIGLDFGLSYQGFSAKQDVDTGIGTVSVTENVNTLGVFAGISVFL